MPLLLALIAVLLVGGGAYFVVHQQSSSQTASEDNLNGLQTLPTTNNQGKQTQTTTNAPLQTSKNNATAAPAITVISVHSDGPATITISYSNLPKQTGALAVCMDNGACTEWVEQFTPSSSSGTYIMSAKKAFGSGSQKGLSAGKYKIVVIGSEFSNQIMASNIFTIQQTQMSPILSETENLPENTAQGQVSAPYIGTWKVERQFSYDSSSQLVERPIKPGSIEDYTLLKISPSEIAYCEPGGTPVTSSTYFVCDEDPVIQYQTNSPGIFTFINNSTMRMRWSITNTKLEIINEMLSNGQWFSLVKNVYVRQLSVIEKRSR